MATNPIGGESAIVTSSNSFPPAAAGHIAAKLLNRHSPHEIAEAIEVLVDVLDCLGGDLEAEAATWPETLEARGEDALPDDSEPAGDELDTPWPEWHTRGRRKSDAHEMRDTNAHEDAEDDDPDTGVEDDPQGFDPETDMAVDDQGCDEDTDGEIYQMPNDVPMLPMVSYEHNVFNDQRVSLGISNLQTSYRTNGGEVRSAKTGKTHRSCGWVDKPGVPV